MKSGARSRTPPVAEIVALRRRRQQAELGDLAASRISRVDGADRGRRREHRSVGVESLHLEIGPVTGGSKPELRYQPSRPACVTGPSRPNRIPSPERRCPAARGRPGGTAPGRRVPRRDVGAGSVARARKNTGRSVVPPTPSGAWRRRQRSARSQDRADVDPLPHVGRLAHAVDSDCRRALATEPAFEVDVLVDDTPLDRHVEGRATGRRDAPWLVAKRHEPLRNDDRDQRSRRHERPKRSTHRSHPVSSAFCASGAESMTRRCDRDQALRGGRDGDRLAPDAGGRDTTFESEQFVAVWQDRLLGRHGGRDTRTVDGTASARHGLGVHDRRVSLHDEQFGLHRVRRTLDVLVGHALAVLAVGVLGLGIAEEDRQRLIPGVTPSLVGAERARGRRVHPEPGQFEVSVDHAETVLQGCHRCQEREVALRRNRSRALRRRDGSLEAPQRPPAVVDDDLILREL